MVATERRNRSSEKVGGGFLSRRTQFDGLPVSLCLRADHVESGEEQFLVEWDKADDTV